MRTASPSRESASCAAGASQMAQARGLGPRTEAPSWTAELQTHERDKRRFVDEGFLKGPTVRMDQKQIKQQERLYDPLLQRFRDDATEARQREFEERERVKHLNVAHDLQLMRERPAHIITHVSRTEPIETKTVTRSIDMADANTMSMPTTCLDYHIITNLPMDVHHFGPPEERPRCVERNPKGRKVQAAQLRDFNIVSNRYTTANEEKTARDFKLNALEAHQKHRELCRFHPIMQKYTEGEVEDRHRTCDDAREVEVRMRREACEPPSYNGRPSAHYDMVTHRADDEGTMNLKLLDTLESQRKSRYKGRHVEEHRHKMNDVVFEDIATNQRHDFVAHERWEETTRRGFDIINNKAYGHGHKFQKLHEPFTVPSLTPWEMAQEDRSGLTPPASSAGPGGSANSSAPSAPVARAPPRPARGTPRGTPRGGSTSATPREKATPRTLSEAGSASLGSARGRPPLLAMSGKPVLSASAPPPPPVPGSPVGSVYSRPKL